MSVQGAVCTRWGKHIIRGTEEETHHPAPLWNCVWWSWRHASSFTHTHTHTELLYTHTHAWGGHVAGVCMCRRPGFSPWVGRSTGGGHGDPLQYSCLEYSMHKGAWWGHKEPDMAQRLTLYFRPTELRPHLQRCQSPVASFTPKSLQTFRSYNAIGLWLLKLSWFSHLFAFALNIPSFWIFFPLLRQTHFKTQLRPHLFLKALQGLHTFRLSKGLSSAHGALLPRDADLYPPFHMSITIHTNILSGWQRTVLCHLCIPHCQT